MYPITHHHVEPTDPHAMHRLDRKETEREHRRQMLRMVGRIARDLFVFAAVAGVLWWLMTGV